MLSVTPTAPLVALAVTLAVQALAAFSLAVPAVLAPAVASEFGMQAQHVGWLVTIAYLSAMVVGLVCGSVSRRHGSVRMSQFALLALSLAMVCCVFTNPWLLLVASVLIGVGYGIPNPTAADILSRHSPRERRGLYFSIKQTGVPAGVAVTGVLMPLLVALMGWRPALLLMAGVLLGVALLIGRARRTLDGSHQAPSGPPSEQALPESDGQALHGLRQTLLIHVVSPLRGIFRNPGLRRLALVSLAYAFTQVIYLSFLVSALKLEHQMSLAAAAALLSASQVVSAAARIGWGYVSDRWVEPGRLLGLLGLGMSVSLVLLGLAPVDAPPLVMLAVTIVCAATAVSWNGVFYADLVRQVAPGEVIRTTGATQFLTFLGGAGGGAGFVALLALTGSYSTGFAVVALLPAISGLAMLRSTRRARQPSISGSI